MLGASGMTLQEVFAKAVELTRSNAQENCAFDLSCMLEDCLGVGRHMLAVRGEEPADPQKTEQFFALVARYAQGEPLQYLLGEWEFYGLPFAVGPGVLIPRPDSETLIDAALPLLRDVAAPVIADLCAGSGCLGIALTCRHPGARGYALELSEQAFPYLTANIARNNARIQAMRCDVRTPPDSLPPLDLIVCNPPYLSAADMDALDSLVAHEPAMALDGGGDGYDFYRVLPAIWKPHLKPGGWLLFEVGHTQAAQTAGLLAKAGYTEICIYPDACGIERVVAGKNER